MKHILLTFHYIGLCSKLSHTLRRKSYGDAKRSGSKFYNITDFFLLPLRPFWSLYARQFIPSNFQYFVTEADFSVSLLMCHPSHISLVNGQSTAGREGELKFFCHLY